MGRLYIAAPGRCPYMEVPHLHSTREPNMKEGTNAVSSPGVWSHTHHAVRAEDQLSLFEWQGAFLILGRLRGSLCAFSFVQLRHFLREDTILDPSTRCVGLDVRMVNDFAVYSHCDDEAIFQACLDGECDSLSVLYTTQAPFPAIAPRLRLQLKPQKYKQSQPTPTVKGLG